MLNANSFYITSLVVGTEGKACGAEPLKYVSITRYSHENLKKFEEKSWTTYIAHSVFRVNPGAANKHKA